MISLTHFQTVLVDVFDDQLADYDERHGQKHSGSAEQLSAEDDAENDRDRMQIQRLADQCGINQIMVDLSQHEIEASGLQGDKGSSVAVSSVPKAEATVGPRTGMNSQVPDTMANTDP